MKKIRILFLALALTFTSGYFIDSSDSLASDDQNVPNHEEHPTEN